MHFFSEFRTGTSAISQRRSEWSSKIKDHINGIIATDQGEEPSTEEPSQKRGAGGPLAVVDADIDFANKLRMLVAALRINHNPEVYKQLLNLIKIEDVDLEALDDWWLRGFLLPESELEPGEAKKVVECAIERWPELEVTEESVMMMKEGIIEYKICIPYAHLRGFLAQCHMIFKEYASNTDEPPDKATIASMVYSNSLIVKTILGPAYESRGPRVSLQDDEFGAFVEAVAQHLTKISEACALNEAALLEVCGMQATTMTMSDAATVYALTTDRDTAILAFGQGQRVMQGENARVLRSVKESIDGLIEVLMKAGLAS